MELDHITIPVLDYDAAKEFYARALEPFGFSVLLDWHDHRRAYLGVHPNPSSIWLVESRKAGAVDLAVAVDEPAAVDAYHAAFVAAGARSVFEPGIRPERTREYYAGRIVDRDGNKLEFVHRGDAAARVAA
jgi:catechol 2,3-dioxygenase-like lactoylglutathione lyase family enzyme